MTKTISREQLLSDISHAGEKVAELCGTCADDHRRLAGYMRTLLSAMDSEPVDELVSLINRLAHSFKKANPDSDLPNKALDYLKRKGLDSQHSPLRDAAPPAPVSFPETLPCPVLLEPGMRFGNGVKTRLMLEALQRRAERTAELEAMTPEQREEHDAGIEALRAMLPAPVAVPDEREAFEQWWCVYADEPKAYVEGQRTSLGGYYNEFIDRAWHSWQACRTAMQAEPVSQRYTLLEEKGSSLQLRNLIRQRHAEWSQKTFGNVGPVGPLKHLAKEAIEAADAPDDLSEWADMQFLLWDAQRRAGISDAEITAAMEEKLKVNMARQWPEPKDGEPRLHIKPEQEV